MRVHERYNVENPCPGEGVESGIRHECDLPRGHTSRHMCGECGRYFDGDEEA